MTTWFAAGEATARTALFDTAPDFRICSWRTNDCKNDLSAEKILEFCRSVLAYHDKMRG